MNTVTTTLPKDPLATHTAKPLRVLITGSAGAIGRRVGPLLRQRGHFVRGFDLHSPPAHTCDQDFLGDLGSPELLRQALEGCDALIHLAATPDEADFLTRLLPNNISGLYHLLEAARDLKVPRWVLASSVQVVNALPRQAEPLRITDGPAPSNFYGCTKVFLESVGAMYAHGFGHSVIIARLGWFIRNSRENARVQNRTSNQPFNVYISHQDMARFLIAAIEADLPAGKHHVLWCMSQQKPPGGYDLSPSEKVIGYKPLDVYPQGSSFAE